MRCRAVALAVALVGAAVGMPWPTVVAASEPETLDAAALLATRYRVEPDVVYLVAGGWSGKLDLYLPRADRASSPTVLNFHGGGWVTGSKDEVALELLPYLSMGFAVVNIDYRLGSVAPAPAAVEDCRCALRWVIRHAAQYGFDTARLVMAGSSAGANLALLGALVPPAAGFDQLCPGDEPLRVAAVISLFGVTDVAELLTPPHLRDFAVGWIGPRPDGAEVARRVSPLTYVREGMPRPAIITIHGDSDPMVPYQQAVRFHEALRAARVPNRLVTIRGGRHGDFFGDDVVRVAHAVRDFLVGQGIVEPTKTSTKTSTKTATTKTKTPRRDVR